MKVKSNFIITEIKDNERTLSTKFISENWGSSLSVSQGKIYDTRLLPGFICIDNKNVIGLVTYHIENRECEIVTLDSKVPDKGLGTALINMVLEKARNNNCSRVWLITTNDNINAMRFYQKRGFEWVGFYKNAIYESRQLKPEIPKYGNDNIPIKHEIEFEIKLNLSGDK